VPPAPDTMGQNPLTGPWVWLLTCTICLIVGLVFLFAVLMPEIRVNNSYLASSCVVESANLTESAATAGWWRCDVVFSFVLVGEDGAGASNTTALGTGMTRLEEPGPDLYSNSIDAPKELCDHYTIGEAIACWYDPDSEDLASDAEVAFEQGFTGWKLAVTIVALLCCLVACVPGVALLFFGVGEEWSYYTEGDSRMYSSDPSLFSYGDSYGCDLDLTTASRSA